MHNDLLFDIALVISLGLIAQWVAWRLKLPSIIFLLTFGLFVGPVYALITGAPILDIDHFLGDLLFPVVSSSVAIILFEGGLSLRFRDLEGTGSVVGKLVSVGVAATWIISGVAAHYLFGIGWEVALLLSATLVVTGPTVIIPLLKQIRPKGRVGSILRWEGIVIDPIGAILAVLVFDEIVSGGDLVLLSWVVFITLLVGLGVGWLLAQVMIEVFRRYWIPDALQIPATIGFVLAAFTFSNIIQAESGLLTVTIMGIVMANQRRFDIHKIVEFKETLQVLLLSTLFILLSARMQPSDLEQIGWGTFWFVLIIIFIERPLAAFVSTWGSDLTWQERVFIGWMAPRGIVAASVASIFAIELAEQGIEGAEILLPVTFAVIIGTVVMYSLTSGFVARYLGLSDKYPQGLLIVGGSAWIRELAIEVTRTGHRVVLADTNQQQIDQARKAGIEVYHGNILSEVAQDEISFGGIGRILALTPNPEVNALAGEHYQNIFGTENVFEIQRTEDLEGRYIISRMLGGRTLFPPNVTYRTLNALSQKGAYITTIHLTDAQALQSYVPEAIIPLFSVPDEDNLIIWTEDDMPPLRNNSVLIAMIHPDTHAELMEKKILTD